MYLLCRYRLFMHKKNRDYLLFYLCQTPRKGIILPYAEVSEAVSVSLMAPSGDTSFRARPSSGGTGKCKTGSGIRRTVGCGRLVLGSGASGAIAPVRGSARTPTQEGGRERFARIDRRGTGGAHIDPSPVFQWDPWPPQGLPAPPRPAARRARVRLDDAGLPRADGAAPGGGNPAADEGNFAATVAATSSEGAGKRCRALTGQPGNAGAARGQPRWTAGGDAAVTGIGNAGGETARTFRKTNARKGPAYSTGRRFSPWGRDDWCDRSGGSSTASVCGSFRLPGRQVSFAGQKSVRSLVLTRLTPLFYPKVIHKATKFWGERDIRPIMWCASKIGVDDQREAIASAKAIRARAWATCRASTMWPSSTATPAPDARAASKAAIRRRASATASGVGENAALAAST